MSSEKIISHSTQETLTTARSFAKLLKKGDFVALYGDLGVGKTAFTRGIAQELVPEEQVTSPTYSIVNEYISNNVRLCHFDMYRITDEEDLYSIGFFDYTDCIIVCEWCENIPYALPDSYYKVSIEKISDNDERIITIEEINPK